MNLLSIIIPIKCLDFAHYKKRLILRDRLDKTDVEIIVADDGSPTEVSQEIRTFCEGRNYKYIYINPTDSVFSGSRARNAGLMEAKTKWVCFEDIDFAVTSNHYQQLIEIIRKLHNTPFNFITVPCLYLKEEISEKVMSAGSIDGFADNIVSNTFSCYPKRKNDIHKMWFASSFIALQRKTALQVGGFNEKFYGWGREDSDFIYKLMLANYNIKKPLFLGFLPQRISFKYKYHYRWSFLRMMGIMTAFKGVYAFHLYHETLSWRKTINTKINQKLFEKISIQQEKTLRFEPLVDINEIVTIILGREENIFNIQLLSEIENHCFIEDNDMETVIKKISLFPLKRILIYQPYESEFKQNIYDYLRRERIEVIVVNKAILPNSYYFAVNDFYASFDNCLNSPTKFSLEQRREIKTYIKDIKYGTFPTEDKHRRVDADVIRRRHNILPDQKIFFCDLVFDELNVSGNQVRESFIIELLNLIKIMPNNWIFAYRNDTNNKISIKQAVCFDNYHIQDILQLISAVGTFNQEIAIMATIFGRHIFYFNYCFCQLETISMPWLSFNNVNAELNKLVPVNYDLVERFTFYVRNNLYSYATPARNKQISWQSIKFPWQENILINNYVWDPTKSEYFRNRRYIAKIYTRGFILSILLIITINFLYIHST